MTDLERMLIRTAVLGIVNVQNELLILEKKLTAPRDQALKDRVQTAQLDLAIAKSALDAVGGGK